MINDDTAERMAIEFFKKEGLKSVVDFLRDEECLEEIFGFVVRGQGKKKTKELLAKLPQQLRTYVLVELSGGNDEELKEKLWDIWQKYELPSERPERSPNFPAYMGETEDALDHYFDS